MDKTVAAQRAPGSEPPGERRTCGAPIGVRLYAAYKRGRRPVKAAVGCGSRSERIHEERMFFKKRNGGFYEEDCCVSNRFKRVAFFVHNAGKIHL
jgi:hypothetical protein